MVELSNESLLRVRDVHYCASGLVYEAVLLLDRKELHLTAEELILRVADASNIETFYTAFDVFVVLAIFIEKSANRFHLLDLFFVVGLVAELVDGSELAECQ